MKSAPASAASAASSGECTPQIFTRGALVTVAAVMLVRMAARRVALLGRCGHVRDKTPGAPPQRLRYFAAAASVLLSSRERTKATLAVA